jgi:hypothetical protein
MRGTERFACRAHKIAPPALLRGANASECSIKSTPIVSFRTHFEKALIYRHLKRTQETMGFSPEFTDQLLDVFL